MECDVVIVGGGPVGLSLARSLAASGLDLVVVERAPLDSLADSAPDGREIALTYQSMDILRSLGAWDHIPAEAISPLRQAEVLNAGSAFALSFAADRAAEGEPLGQLVSNHLIRRAIFRSLADQPRLTLLTDAEVTATHTDGHRARVSLADGRTITTRLVVAADSRMSAVRDQLGIAAEVNRLERAMIVCRVTHEHDHGGVATEWFDRRQTIAMLPLVAEGNASAPWSSSAVLTLPTGEARRLAAMAPDQLGAEITRRYQRRLGTMHAITAARLYPLATTYARHFAATRAALIGDAAVGMHPVTAHGFNLGLRSQQTLAGLIAAAAARGGDIAAPTLLARYEAAHRLASWPLYAATNAIVRLYTDERPLALATRHAVLRIGDRLPLVKQGITAMLMQRHPATAATPR